MATKTKPTTKVKKLRYTLKTVIDVDIEMPSDVEDLIQHNRELGECEIENVEIVEVGRDE